MRKKIIRLQDNISLLQRINNDMKTKSSTELWEIQPFLEGFAETVEKAANEKMVEPGTLKIKIFPIENVAGFPLAGYRAEVTGESYGYDDKDLTISMLRGNVDFLEKRLLAISKKKV